MKRIDHHIGVDWSDDPAVFIDVILPGNEIAAAETEPLAEDIRVDLLRLVRTDEIGLHSYLNFVNETGAYEDPDEVSFPHAIRIVRRLS